MANRTFQEDVLGLIKRKVVLYCTVSVGAAGAVTLQKRQFTASGATALAASSSLVAAPTTGVGYAVGDGFGIRSVVRSGTGAWTVTLSDSYQYLVAVAVFGLVSATGLPAATFAGVKTAGTNVTTNSGQGSGGTIAVQLSGIAGTAVDPANGDVVVLEIILGDSTEP